MKIPAPLFVIESNQDCWKCKAKQRVIALASYEIEEEPDEDENELKERAEIMETGEPFLFSKITTLPEDLRAWINAHYPRFQPYRSRMAQKEYWANLCECGANFGDFYLHSEPGGAFFPMGEEDCSDMLICEVPLPGPFQIVCGYNLGSGELIFNYAAWKE